VIERLKRFESVSIVEWFMVTVIDPKVFLVLGLVFLLGGVYL